MIRRTVLRTLATAAVTAALALPLTQGAQAATPDTTAPAAATTPAPIKADDGNPFRWMELDGLRADFRFMCPAGHCVGFWSLVLTDDVARQKFEGGKFFVYAPATREFSFFLDTDIAVRTVAHPGQVRLVDTEFMRSHPRVEVRYGDPDHPGRARVVASATTLM
ncbi:hypothetical protein GO001_17685 [Streptomyces sp. NRRL B-1677]|uniref:Cytotoxic protein n=1 Tax=Streptomyces klenkii TaxID=1420899 RepID=A0A3B0B093_9ACTN|nr:MULTISPECIES: hypothetical protein [Streptomyces]MBF6047043.1 hypothetical protein [Streptomyces sp. NRRL B-1677]RKN65909.1 hypothetical protein D7231_24150 [Streptomyces klenkii]